jgi:POT family proton-dependent oligopeptide transporter
MNQNTNDDFFKTNVLGHPAGLLYCFYRNGNVFLLWNACFIGAFNIKFSQRWVAWTEDALALYGTYTMAVYFTPVIEVC